MPSFQVYLPRGLRPITTSSPTERAPIARGAFFHVAYPLLTVSQTASCSQEHPQQLSYYAFYGVNSVLHSLEIRKGYPARMV